MSEKYISIGDIVFGAEITDLNIELAKSIFQAIEKSENFSFIEIRRIVHQEDSKETEIIIVDCTNSEIHSRNKVGIKSRERLAIAFTVGNDVPFDVYPLRKDFPNKVLHLNHALPGLPRSLCLFFEPWEEVERKLTPEIFLQRISWWLIKSSNNTLHRGDQPLEQLYFSSPIELILPPDYREKYDDRSKTLYLKDFNPNDSSAPLKADFRDVSDSSKIINFFCLTLDPVKHTNVYSFPETLGQLHNQFLERGANLIEKLKEEYLRIVTDKGIIDSPNLPYTIILLTVPRIDIEGELSSKPDQFAFCLKCPSGKLGMLCGSLLRNGTGPYYKETLNFAIPSKAEEWETVELIPIEIVQAITREFAQKTSNFNSTKSDFCGVLIGAGSLGGSISQFWAKGAWGSWTIIDNDKIKAHNVIRHIASEQDIGKAKSLVVSDKMNKHFAPGYSKHLPICDKLTLQNINKVIPILKDGNLIIDATATNHVIRDLAITDELPRSGSIFLSPSGHGSVLLLEDSYRKVRLDYLELIYYRELLSDDFWENFLQKEHSELVIGSGCRDISFVLSFEQIEFHSSLLSRQLRLRSENTAASVSIWKMNDHTGELFTKSLKIFTPIIKIFKDWSLLFDNWIVEKLKLEREKNLPSETGGIIIGYIDQKLKRLYVTDILTAPKDSEASPTGFTRGIEGLSEDLKKIKTRTSNNVSYIGEWHSHPQNSNAMPSSTDLILATKFSEIMAEEGLPHLMVIIAEDDITFSFSAAS
ncbi:Mov34/MPN/PAD-1 family protein [Leptospira interrogans serovar Szwajizak]|uniref:Mov34/MPN/PAD-1 family protein n=1 Tax=Leptospira interrogans TaxID=173 RepID=UPI00034A8200|nr:Mov34/MPN/PAD-1 family protein [Leptospira interrogans]